MSRGGYRGKSRIERFYSNISIATSGCWEWIGAIDKDGYAKVKWGEFHHAHRFSYAHFKGAIPSGICVCHRCDNPKCVNPDHLWIGSPAQNAADRNSKKRQARENRIRKSLSIETAGTVRELALGGAIPSELAAQFNISIAQVSLLKHGKTWHFRRVL